jgi:hypothetical protein
MHQLIQKLFSSYSLFLVDAGCVQAVSIPNNAQKHAPTDTKAFFHLILFF